MIGRTLALLVLLTAPTHAEVPDSVRDAEHRFQLELPDPAWTPIDLGETAAPLAGFRDDDSGAVAAIARVDYPNPDAWRGKRRFFDDVERGLSDAADGYRRLHLRRHRLGRVPALDITFRRGGTEADEIVFTRFLFFRRYSLALTVTVPRDRFRPNRRALKGLVRSFEPYFEDS